MKKPASNHVSWALLAKLTLGLGGLWLITRWQAVLFLGLACSVLTVVAFLSAVFSGSGHNLIDPD